VKLHSISDAITNSSTEILTIFSDKCLSIIENTCKELHKALNLPGEWTDYFIIDFTLKNFYNAEHMYYNEEFIDFMKRNNKNIKAIKFEDFANYFKTMYESSDISFRRKFFDFIMSLDDFDYGMEKENLNIKINVKNSDCDLMFSTKIFQRITANC
jgi:hypothetical protein